LSGSKNNIVIAQTGSFAKKETFYLNNTRGLPKISAVNERTFEEYLIPNLARLQFWNSGIKIKRRKK